LEERKITYGGGGDYTRSFTSGEVLFIILTTSSMTLIIIDKVRLGVVALYP
jgi:hypothetical protein